ncbi:ATP-binding protein [candidate division WOR-3 bacterium]|nr:ATP-binding protein [candidate division WOR-3 bacterium]
MKRNIYRNLLSWKEKKNRKPLIIKGARQTGKTYTVQEFGKNEFSKLHYINFEKDRKASQIFVKDLNPDRILNEMRFFLSQDIDSQNDLIFFDEIQEEPRALTSLKYFSEEKPGINIISAGSLIGLHLTEESSFPVGKVEFLNMYPMNFEEFLEGSGENLLYSFLKEYDGKINIPEIIHEKFVTELKKYFVVGGMPEAIKIFTEYKNDTFKAFNNVREYQENLLYSINADMAKHSGKQNSMQIERVFRSIPEQLSRIRDGSSGRYIFKNVIPGVNRYSRMIGVIDWLVTADLVLKTHIIDHASVPLTGNIKENMMKLYFYDIGLLGSISGLSPKSIIDYDYGRYKGYFAESFAARELVTDYNVKLFSWFKNRAEIDFLVEKNGKVIPIEIKAGEKIKTKSLNFFNKICKSEKSYVLSMRSFHEDNIGGTANYPLYMISRILELKK